MLAYTLDRMLVQRAVIERNMAQVDAGGGEQRPNWQPHLTVACLLWWDKSYGARSANRTYVSPAREVSMSEGGLLMAIGTDVTEQDRIVHVLDGQGNVFTDGLITIVAVLNQQTHMELSISRAHLGA